MRSERNLKGLVASLLLVGVPLLLNACSGNPLNGEKLSLFGGRNQNPGNAAGGQSGGNPGPQPSHPVGPSGASGPSGPACNPDVKGTIEPNDSDLIKFNGDVNKIENTQPSRTDLLNALKTYVTTTQDLGLKPEELKAIAESILARSPDTAPISASPQPQPAPNGAIPPVSGRPGAGLEPPQPAGPAAAPAHGTGGGTALAQDQNVPTVVPPSGSPAPVGSAAPAPSSSQYYLHQSIVALVAYEHAIQFAKDNKLGNKASDIAKFASDLLFPAKLAQPDKLDWLILTYVKAYNIAVDPDGLNYKADQAQQWLSTLLGRTNGVQMALAWVRNFSDDVFYGMTKPDSIKDANQKLGYTPGSDVAAGFCFNAPHATAASRPTTAHPAPQPAPKQPASNPRPARPNPAPRAPH
jgi:hypothetical protein